MNKEIEKAIYRLKLHKEGASLENGTCIVNVKDLETVLQALNNSISEEKVRKELNHIENMIDKTTRGEIQKYTVRELILFRTIYNKLLEE